MKTNGNIFNNSEAAVTFLIITASVVLIYDPLLWLVRTWQDPSYDSQGFFVFLVCLSVFIWSVTSKVRSDYVIDSRLIIGLFLFTASIRAAGQLMAVNTVGALALIIDVYAIGLLLGLKYRQLAISPGWLALAFMFALPLERIIQRSIGYGLQNFSAEGACLVLQTIFGDVECFGIRIVLENKDILVDLPCSGARTALTLFLLYTVAASLCRPSPLSVVTGAVITLCAALFSNVVRITLLSIGIARPEYFHGANVMEQPWHDSIGLFTLVLGAIPILFWAGKAYNNKAQIKGRSNTGRFTPVFRNKAGIVSASAFLVFSIVIVSLPRQAVDVARKDIPLYLPQYLNGYSAQHIPLQEKELKYFTQYGGSAVKAAYGPFNLLAVRTSAPLRHLHAPDECLRGLGFKVRYLGMVYTPVPTSHYRVEDHNGDVFLVSVSFISSKGHITSNISEAVWYWLQNPKTTWTAIQRISPFTISETERVTWEHSVLTSFDITPKIKTQKHSSKGVLNNE